MLHPLKIFAVVCLIASRVSAAEWVSTNGDFAVPEPDAVRFTQIEAPPPLAAMWVSSEGTITLGIWQTPVPAGVKLDRSALEEGAAEELKGKIVDSSVLQKEGYEVYLMTVQGEALGNEVYLSQAIVTVGDTVYKVMASGHGTDVRKDADAMRYVSSFKIL